jgi:hypothetical protein
MGDSQVSSAGGAWMRREGFSSAVHYFPAGKDTSTCGLMSVDGRWRWGRVRRSKHGVCLLCESRYEKWHSTTVNRKPRPKTHWTYLTHHAEEKGHHV